jgi:hypothetical protein
MEHNHIIKKGRGNLWGQEPAGVERVKGEGKGRG